RLHWTVEIAGQVREFDAKITEQNPDERIAWATIDGPHQAGVVTFHRLGDNQTKVMLQMEYDPEGLVEKAGDALGIVKSRVKGDLERFKTFIETRGQETGAWRGEVDQTKTS
ncbi:MAG: SRPBCC family protein, partial [Actinomycetota bacterium]|nr:SRPBCC family protein [Actinomycetota bacterium]